MGLINQLVGPVLACSLVAGCVSGNFNQPDNQPTNPAPRPAEIGPQNGSDFGETVIELSFSGGGTRASAFASFLHGEGSVGAKHIEAHTRLLLNTWWRSLLSG